MGELTTYMESLTNEGLVEGLFNQFKNYLESKELIFNEEQLVDASFTIAPRQRNTREENKKIKNGEQHTTTLFIKAM